MTYQERDSEFDTEHLEELAAGYAAIVPEYCRQIESLWLEVGLPGTARQSFDHLIQLCHRFSGSAASYNLSNISEIVTDIENSVRTVRDRGGTFTATELDYINLLVNRLLDRGAHITPEQVFDSSQTTGISANLKLAEPLIYIVDDNGDQARKLALQLISYGYRTVAFNRLGEVQEAVRKLVPAAIISDSSYLSGENADLDTITRILESRDPPLPIIFTSRRKDARNRLAALRAGGGGYFTGPISLTALAGKLHELTRAIDQQPFRVLIVDDDPTINLLHSAILEKGGCKVVSISNPLEVFEKAVEFEPEVIFLDLYMPEANGHEIGNLLRQDDDLREIPIVILSGEEDQKIHTQAIREGAAIFLNKPVSPGLLLDVATSRASHYRTRVANNRYLQRIDTVTGLFNRSYFLQKLDKYCNSRRRYSGISALVMIEINNFDYLLRTLGEEQIRLLRAHVAHLIRVSIAKRSIAASYTDNVFLILMRQPDLKHLENAIDRVYKTLTSRPTEVMGNTFELPFKIGVSKVGNNNYDLVLSQAAQACSQARPENQPIFFHPDLLHEALEEREAQELQRQVRSAIKNRRLVLVYSRLMSLTVETYERFTILMRLQDDQGELIYPTQFLGMANRHNIMSGLDRWTVKSALESLGQRQGQQPQTQYFIKLSVGTILDVEFLPWLRKTLKNCAINPRSCVFEIDEENLTANLEQLRRFIENLHEVNCMISIEHLGKEKPSINLLRMLNPDFLRLDASILRGITEDGEQQDYVRTLCEQAHEFDCKVLTPFLDDPRLLSALWQFGVDFIQDDFMDPHDHKQQPAS